MPLYAFDPRFPNIFGYNIWEKPLQLTQRQSSSISNFREGVLSPYNIWENHCSSRKGSHLASVISERGF